MAIREVEITRQGNCHRIFKRISRLSTINQPWTVHNHTGIYITIAGRERIVPEIVTDNKRTPQIHTPQILLRHWPLWQSRTFIWGFRPGHGSACGSARSTDRPVGTGGRGGEVRASTFLKVDSLSNVDYSIKMICRLLRWQKIAIPLLQFQEFSRGRTPRTPQAQGE